MVSRGRICHSFRLSFCFFSPSTQGQLPASCQILFVSTCEIVFHPSYSHVIRTDCRPSARLPSSKKKQNRWGWSFVLGMHFASIITCSGTPCVFFSDGLKGHVVFFGMAGYLVSAVVVTGNLGLLLLDSWLACSWRVIWVLIRLTPPDTGLRPLGC